MTINTYLRLIACLYYNPQRCSAIFSLSIPALFHFIYRCQSFEERIYKLVPHDDRLAPAGGQGRINY